MNEITKKEPTIFEMLCNKATKIQIIEHFGRLTMRQVVAQQPPALCQIKRSEGKKAIEKATAILIADLSSSFGGDLKKEEILELNAELHNSIYRNLALEDIYIICRRIKTADIYGKLTVNKVLKHIKDYWSEKINDIDNYTYSQHLQQKAQEPAGELTEMKVWLQEQADIKKVK